ncbi:hypothetical protein F0145_17045 [Adhaeribacter rhizoryzae]|uniref:Small multi-drug export protein n=2 Tax=Adhaeribacter rhizoryzae TaxID=2607907 RepID=A0A5M6DDY5_9BACT|nr:hypothetical protein F0145_17045 [Adhaeribacter rhizoryzae]
MSVFLLSMVKFFGGPLAGVSLGLSLGATMALTVAGMMTSVFIFSGIGTLFSKWYAEQQRQKQKPIFTKKNRRIVRVWQRFGMVGIAFLTPILLTPIIGTVVATVLGASQRHILVHMLWSAVFWGVTLTFLVSQVSTLNLPFLHR